MTYFMFEGYVLTYLKTQCYYEDFLSWMLHPFKPWMPHPISYYNSTVYVCVQFIGKAHHSETKFERVRQIEIRIRYGIMNINVPAGVGAMHA